MLTAACLAISLATLGACCWAAYWVGYTRKLRQSEGYLAGKLAGYQDGILHGERVRNELRAERDRLDAALDELGALYDRKAAEPLIHAVQRATGEIILTGAEVYDHEEAGP